MTRVDRRPPSHCNRAWGGRLARLTLLTSVIPLALLSLGAIGCATTPKPIFKPVFPALVWPKAPDAPRIQYVGELRGEESLGIRATGLEAIAEVLSGPKPRVAFASPTAVTTHGQRVYVADTGIPGVHLLDLDTREYKLITGSESDPLQTPIDVAIAHDNALLVVDRARAVVDLFELDGHFRETVRWPAISAPVSVAWDAAAQTVWLADAASHRLFSIPDSAATPTPFGGRGGEPGRFNYPTGLAVHSTAGLAVADAMNFRVQLLDRQSRPLAVFGERGDAAGNFARPRDVAYDSAGHVYVVDNQFENVQVFDQSGRVLMVFGQGGQGAGEFSLPAGIWIDPRDRIWIADSYNRRVQVFQYLPEQPS